MDGWARRSPPARAGLTAALLLAPIARSHPVGAARGRLEPHADIRGSAHARIASARPAVGRDTERHGSLEEREDAAEHHPRCRRLDLRPEPRAGDLHDRLARCPGRRTGGRCPPGASSVMPTRPLTLRAFSTETRVGLGRIESVKSPRSARVQENPDRGVRNAPPAIGIGGPPRGPGRGSCPSRHFPACRSPLNRPSPPAA